LQGKKTCAKLAVQIETEARMKPRGHTPNKLSISILFMIFVGVSQTVFAATPPAAKVLRALALPAQSCPGYDPAGWLDSGGKHHLVASGFNLQIQGPPGSVLQLSITAPRWEGETATVYTYEDSIELKEPVSRIEIPILGDALNHVAVVLQNERLGAATTYHYEITACPGFRGPPIVFQQGPVKTVTQAELDAKLVEIIREVTKVSRELGRFLETNVAFYDGETTKASVKPRSSFTMLSTRIEVSRKQWRAALLQIKCARTAAERRMLTERHFRQFLSQMLHEASHRHGMVGGLVPTQNPRRNTEEKRNTEALVERMINLLERMKAAIEATDATSVHLGDGSGLHGEDLRLWFERISVVVKRQKLYRWQWLGAIRPWNRIGKRLQEKWDKFKGELEEIRESNRSDADKRAAAQARFDRFNNHRFKQKPLSQHASEFADAHDMNWQLGFDPNSLKPIYRVTCKTKFKGKTIPHL
jgi:hypothetical protein